ncbi:hypothetical protein PYW08_016163 [Mythimna loreyi]|uniref:Uncharacterized protein n=1 Tax=Mythimna loreyi TaxID=667449 RepID=A0ACC2QVD9_9NEOP|nr:hypothetical protein PYW08_016163 [Mythimna loreyi]
MFKLLVLSCLLFSCLADPFGLPSWLRESARRLRHPRGCADRGEGWRACARLNDSSALAPHGSDCSVFFYCSAQGRPACRRCPAGLHFNPQLQVCDWPSEVNCTSRPPRPPRPPRGNDTTPYPTTTDEAVSVTVTDYPTSTPEETRTYPTSTTTELPQTSDSTYRWVDYWGRK